MPFKQIHHWLLSQLHLKLLVCTGFLPPRSILVSYTFFISHPQFFKLIAIKLYVAYSYLEIFIRAVISLLEVLCSHFFLIRFAKRKNRFASIVFDLFSWFLELKAAFVYFSCSLTHLGHTFSFSRELFFLILGFWHVALCHSLRESLKGVSDLLFNPRDTMRGVLTFSGRCS